MLLDAHGAIQPKETPTHEDIERDKRKVDEMFSDIDLIPIDIEFEGIAFAEEVSDGFGEQDAGGDNERKEEEERDSDAQPAVSGLLTETGLADKLKANHHGEGLESDGKADQKDGDLSDGDGAVFEACDHEDAKADQRPVPRRKGGTDEFSPRHRPRRKGGHALPIPCAVGDFFGDRTEGSAHPPQDAERKKAKKSEKRGCSFGHGNGQADQDKRDQDKSLDGKFEPSVSLDLWVHRNLRGFARCGVASWMIEAKKRALGKEKDDMIKPVWRGWFRGRGRVPRDFLFLR